MIPWDALMNNKLVIAISISFQLPFYLVCFTGNWPIPHPCSCVACSKLLTDMGMLAEGETADWVSYQYSCKRRWPKWRRARGGWGTIKQNWVDPEVWRGGGEAWIWNAQTTLVPFLSPKSQFVRKMIRSGRKQYYPGASFTKPFIRPGVEFNEW